MQFGRLDAYYMCFIMNDKVDALEMGKMEAKSCSKEACGGQTSTFRRGQLAVRMVALRLEQFSFLEKEDLTMAPSLIF